MATSGSIDLGSTFGGGGGGGVTSLNSLTGALNLVAGTGITVTPAGSNITIAATNSGTVTSVALTAPAAVFSVTGSPVTSSGTLALAFTTQTANTIFAGPTTGGAATPTFRTLVTADLPFVIGNLTAAGTDGIVVTGGTGSVIGAGTSLAQHVADSTHNGYLSQTDWSTFNGKQAAGNYITDLTGDVTATGPGSVAATIANLAVTNAKIANATIDLTTKVTGILPIANGGTNASSVTNARANLGIADGFSLQTSGVTYTTPANITTATQFKFTLIGGGGAGGGSPTTTNAHGAGGGGGATCIVWLTGLSPSTGYTMAIGAAGTGNSNATGNAGGNTTISINATTYTANGGSGGAATASTNGAAGGTATNGTLNITGGNGGASITNVSSGAAGNGGSSQYGLGGQGPITAATGTAGTGFGGAGSGSMSAASAANQTGGAGTQGMILVEWIN